MSSRVSWKQFAILSTVLFCISAMPAPAATITVTNTNDGGPGSLRQALHDGNDGDTIRFAVTGTIALTSGGLPINKSLTISGPGKDQLSIDGNQALLVFGIFPDKTAMISDLTIRNGQTGIWNEHGTLTVNNSDDGGGQLTGPGDQINTDPLLGPLRNHGGPTLTHMPMRGSPAIDAGDPNFTPPPDHDQRGACFYRVFGGRIDVGSVETQPRPPCVTPAPRPTPR